MFHFSLFFQIPVTESQHFLLPLFEAIDLKEKNQYPRYDYNKVPHGTCFKQSIFAGKNLESVKEFVDTRKYPLSSYPPAPRPKIFLISYSFLENLAKSYAGAPSPGWRPLLRGILDPPLDRKSKINWELNLMQCMVI